MKNRIAMLCTALLVAMLVCIDATAQGKEMTERDQHTLEAAVHFMDNGMVAEGIELLINLNAKYPDNIVVMHELAYVYSMLGDHVEASKWGRKMLELDSIPEEALAMAANTLSYSGHYQEAVAAYDSGLERNPNSGRLWLEKGNAANIKGDYNEAVRCYFEAIRRQPGYDVPYYRLARLYATSNDPVWAIPYAETYINLSHDEERLAELSGLITALYQDNIKLRGKEASASFTGIKLGERDETMIDCLLPYNVFFEENTLKALQGPYPGDTLTAKDVLELRMRYVEAIDTLVHDYYDIPVLQLQREACRAGFNQEYNMWLLSYGNPGLVTECGITSENMDQRLTPFFKWLEQGNHVKLSRRGVPHINSHSIAMLDVDAMKRLAAKEDPSTMKDAARAWSKWLINIPCDTTSSLRATVMSSLLLWSVATLDIKITIGDSQLLTTPKLMGVGLAVMIDQLQERNMKELDRTGYVEAMMCLVDYARRNKRALGLDSKTLQYIGQNDDTLRDLMGKEYDKMNAEPAQPAQRKPSPRKRTRR